MRRQVDGRNGSASLDTETDERISLFTEVAQANFFTRLTMKTSVLLADDHLIFLEALKKLVESFRDWGRDCWCAPGMDNTCGKRFDWHLADPPGEFELHRNAAIQERQGNRNPLIDFPDLVRAVAFELGLG